jgi:hypothetical protein
MASRLSTNFGYFFILLAVLLSGCQLTPTPLIRDQQAQVSLLVSLDTSAQIKREGWKDYQPVGFGALVYATDLLRTDGNITLLCADLQTIKTLTGLGRNPCPLQSDGFALQYDDMLFSPGVRGSTASTIPTLISPRNTTILDSHPILRWHDTGTATYTVEIYQGSKSVWIAKNIVGTEIVYPAEAPMLVAGKDYLLVITDNATGRSSTDDTEKGLGFQIVSEAERVEIETQRQSVFNLDGLDEPAEKLALVMYYINLRIGGRGLWNDARILLEEVIQARPNEPVIFLRLGDVLAKMKLWDEASTAYDTARIQAKNLKDLETQADALAALWRIEPSQMLYGQEAATYYEQIGASAKAQALKKEMNP